ncbi:hydantoinase/carbamoylase family amidase [Jeotgalibacillus soli]|uniref:Peptidase M20 dimerisation domain-containing protein n=1 Tax=Jeotgalibacillus soli TaxID=889306 RepID=A0A0C2R2X4_9BACL|nr:hydantoinase/carbamoylase family amidase [Jeotgalibacillus soli]KIL44605.1 hypothetical protein KP78_35690 [Jeotgalibacillus soli]
MQTICQINSERMYNRIMRLAKIGKVNDTGVQRVALSEEDKDAQVLVIEWMKEAGMIVSHDHFGNLIGRKEGKSPSLPSVMIGSHIDSVRNGGRFDGIIGVIGGLEIVQSIYDADISHDHPIEVVAFCEEEGSRFSDGLFGSRGMVGKIKREHLGLKDEDGISRYDALKSFGFGIDPDLIEQSVRKAGDIKMYLEMHIEQGPYLDANDYPVGIVSGIAGPSWLKVRLKGEAGHAGTVPMNLRRDPLIGTAEVVIEVESLCMADPNAPTVGTIGKMAVFPGGNNIIPESVEFTLDIRDIELVRRNNVIQKIEEKIKHVCKSRGLEYEIERFVDEKPVKCSENLVDSLREAASSIGIAAPVMVSGAGHDAMLLAKITDIGMVFVRCRDGISHQPKEWAEIADILLGTKVLYKTVLKYL